MPELPEVETVARDLARSVTGATIVDADVSWDRTIRHPQPPERFVAELRGARIARVGRRAKSVLIFLEDGRVLTVALRMTGQLLVRRADEPRDPYVRVAFRLDDGRELRFRDVRKFGRIGLWAPGGLRTRARRRAVGRGRRAPGERRGVAEATTPYRVGDVFGAHGPEPLSQSFGSARFAELLRGRRARLKPLLIDQSFIAGVGNIYADEALWLARLHPLRTADSLSGEEARRLHRSIRAVLRAAISNRGSSVDDYVDAEGRPGRNAERLRVYRRADQPCYRCGRPISRIVIGQRSTHFCAHCQRAPDR